MTDGRPEILLHVAENSEMSSVLDLPVEMSAFGAVEVETARVLGKSTENILVDLNRHIAL